MELQFAKSQLEPHLSHMNIRWDSHAKKQRKQLKLNSTYKSMMLKTKLTKSTIIDEIMICVIDTINEFNFKWSQSSVNSYSDTFSWVNWYAVLLTCVDLIGNRTRLPLMFEPDTFTKFTVSKSRLIWCHCKAWGSLGLTFSFITCRIYQLEILTKHVPISDFYFRIEKV